MAQFTQNGVIYEELPDGNVRVVGYADQQPQGMQIKPADPTRQYQGPKAATELEGGQLDNEFKKTQIMEATAGKLPVGWRRRPDGGAEPIPGIPVNDPNKPKATPPSTQAVRAAKQTLSILQKQNELFMDQFSGDGIGAIAEYNPFSGASQQFNDYSTQILPYTKQLMRSPGEGAQSDKDAADYRALLPSNLVYDETNINRMTNIRDAALDVLKAAGEDVSQYDSLIPGQAPPSRKRNDGAAPNMNATVESGPPGSQGDGNLTPLWSEPGPSGGSGGGGGLESLIMGNGGAIDARNRNSIVGAIDAFGRNFANAGTIGLADKIAAAGNAILPIDNLFGADNRSVWDGSSFGQAYDANMRLQNRTNAADRKANPWASTAGDVSGTVAGALLANQALTKAGAGALVARTGGVAGDVAYGTSRGAVEGGGKGALIGGGTALGGGVLGRYVLGPAVGAAAASRPGQAVINTVGRGANAVANAGRGLIGRGPQRFQPVNLPRNLPRGSRAIAARLPDNAGAQFREAQNLGLPLTVGDLSPELQALTGSVVRKSTNARELAETNLRPRFLGQADRARDQIARNFGPIDNPNEISDQLLQQARTNAAPLYDDFRAQPARTSDELQAILSTPAGQQALRNAQSIAANEGRDPNALGFDLDDLGQIVFRHDPSPETLDLVKRGLDDTVSASANPLTGRIETDAGRAIEGLRRRFVGEVDRLYPQYAPARAAYAGPAAERAALQQGRDMARAHPRDIQVTMGRQSPGQQEQFRLGQRVAMADAVDRARLTTNPYQSVWGGTEARNRAATVFGDGPASNFQRAYDIEDTMGRTYQEALGGSQTAPRLAADEAFDSMIGNAAEAGGAIITGGGGLGDLARRVAGGVRDNWRVGASRQLADEMAPILLTPRPDQMAQAIEQMAAQSAARRLYIDNARRTGGLFGASIGISAAPSIR